MAHPKGWNDPHAERKVWQRNLRFPDIASMGFNCVKKIITLKSQLLDLKSIVQKYGEDGKYGLRLHKPPKGLLLHNGAFVNASPVAYNRKTLKDNDFCTNLRFKSKQETIEHIDTLIAWRESVLKYDNICRKVSNIELVLAEFRRSTCTNCKRPHYEHVVETNSFHVCTYCGCQYNWSNIQTVGHVHMDSEGNFNNNQLTYTTPGQTTVDPFPNGDHKIRASRVIRSIIGRLCEFLNCDTGDGERHIRKWAWKVYDEYIEIIKLKKRREYDYNGKMKMGRIQLASVFVWFSILHMEKRTNCTSKWSLSLICEEAANIHKDEFSVGKKRKRNTRPFKLDIVHRYALVVQQDMGEKWKNWCNFEIPHIKSINCTRVQNVREEMNKYTQCIGKQMHYIYLPDDKTWDIDIVLEEGLIRIYPDHGHIGFENGLRKGDILTHINKKAAGNTVNDVYDQIIELKRAKCDKHIITLTILR